MSGFRGEGWSPGQPTRKASSHSKARGRCRAPLFFSSTASIRQVGPLAARVPRRPSSFWGDPSSFSGEGPSFWGDPSSFLGEGPSFLGDPSSLLGEGSSFLGDPSSFLGEGPSFLGDPSPLTA